MSTIIVLNTKKSLGGLDLSVYCIQHLKYNEALPDKADWYCSGQSTLKITMTLACNWQYQDKKNLVTTPTNTSNASSWLCYDTQKQVVGGIKDMDGYCQSQGFTNAKLAGKQTINDWTCMRPARQKIDMNGACIWQYNQHDAYAINNENGLWECKDYVFLW